MTTWLKVKNNAASELASAITDSATELTLKTGEASRFPASFPFHITIGDEILEVAAISEDTLTVTRAQEGTSAASHNAGAAVRLNITSAIFEELQSEIDNKQSALPLTTKGDLLAFGTALARLAVGSNGQVLQADDAEDLGIKWATIGTGYVSMSTGSYTGNATQNRAIPHGLESIPRLVLIFHSTGTTIYLAFLNSNYAKIFCLRGLSGTASFHINSVTAMDVINFYIGAGAGMWEISMNYSGYVYYWIALG
jgi:hypothetical protein